MKKLLSLFLLTAVLSALPACREIPPAAEPAPPQPTVQSEALTEPSAQSSKALTEPPELTVVWGETSVKALRGGYSWEIVNEDGTVTATIADSAHPLQCKDIMPVLTLTPSYLSHIEPLTAHLRFETAPDEISARCWSEAHWDAVDAESEAAEIKTVEIDLADGSWDTDHKLTLKDGGYIYEVTARWNRSASYSGTASYSFCTAKPDIEMHPVKKP